MTDPARRLGVGAGADAAAIRAAFALRVRAVHPDTAGPAGGSPEELAALIAARDRLLGPPRTAPAPSATVVFHQHRPVRDGLRALWPHRRPTRHLL